MWIKGSAHNSAQAPPFVTPAVACAWSARAFWVVGDVEAAHASTCMERARAAFQVAESHLAHVPRLLSSFEARRVVTPEHEKRRHAAGMKACARAQARTALAAK